MTITVLRENDAGTVRRAWQFVCTEAFRLELTAFKVYRADAGGDFPTAPDEVWHFVDVTERNTLEGPDPVTRELADEALTHVKSRIALAFPLHD